MKLRAATVQMLNELGEGKRSGRERRKRTDCCRTFDN